MKLFEQNALSKISDECFWKMSSAYENEQKELTYKGKDVYNTHWMMEKVIENNKYILN